MKKKLFLFSAIALLLITGFFAYKKLHVQKKYNVVWIVSDALRADVLGCYGGDDISTPNIDSLARQGVLFENAYSTSPWTPASAVSMLTGTYPNIYRNGVIGDLHYPNYDIPDNYFRIGDLFQSGPYLLLKSCENPNMVPSRLFRGFKQVNYNYKITPPQQMVIEQVTGIRNHSEFYHEMYYFLMGFFSPALKDRPFFFFKWILDPHSPYNPPEKFKNTIPVNLSKLSQDPAQYSELLLVGKETVFHWNTQEKKYLKDLYKKEVKSVDERVGYVLKALKHQNLLDSTFFIFTSDHGELFGEKNEWSHGLNYSETLIRVPLIISGPNIPNGRKVKNVVSLIDLTPTIADLLNLDIKAEIQGRSFANLLFEGNSDNNNCAYFVELGQDIYEYLDAYRENDYKLVLSKDKHYNLYNLANDPEELNDISKKNPVIVNNMLNKVSSLREENNNRKIVFPEEPKHIVDQDTLDNLRHLGYIK
jgi:arylsulfatase A-like enzyme